MRIFKLEIEYRPVEGGILKSRNPNFDVTTAEIREYTVFRLVFITIVIIRISYLNTVAESVTTVHITRRRMNLDDIELNC